MVKEWNSTCKSSWRSLVNREHRNKTNRKHLVYNNGKLIGYTSIKAIRCASIMASETKVRCTHRRPLATLESAGQSVLSVVTKLPSVAIVEDSAITFLKMTCTPFLWKSCFSWFLHWPCRRYCQSIESGHLRTWGAGFDEDFLIDAQHICKMAGREHFWNCSDRFFMCLPPQRRGSFSLWSSHKRTHHFRGAS